MESISGSYSGTDLRYAVICTTINYRLIFSQKDIQEWCNLLILRANIIFLATINMLIYTVIIIWTSGKMDLICTYTPWIYPHVFQFDSF